SRDRLRPSVKDVHVADQHARREGHLNGSVVVLEAYGSTAGAGTEQKAVVLLQVFGGLRTSAPL
ncbi:MAG TPA: hypothetical protein VN894_11425, partial [Polyangiaceae bacterium]|nr:hypothetical protein [Polyangiaceae bacterium]